MTQEAHHAFFGIVGVILLVATAGGIIWWLVDVAPWNKMALAIATTPTPLLVSVSALVLFVIVGTIGKATDRWD